MHPQAQSIFEEAIGKPEQEREAFVTLACAANTELLAEVKALLQAHQNARSFLSEPTGGGKLAAEISSGAATMVAAVHEAPGSKIGHYKLLQQIGEGGFGVVFLAEQEQPVRRRVALKIIKLGMDTRQVIARFEAERQALALMDHPNIAKVLDAGATDAGRPFFVMELVKGDPITEYCDKNNLNTEERLDLFIQICHAVQHAHQKGIIHRDIKPSNVLVTIADGKPIPKVIDFGIAKATSARLTERTLFTEHRALIGTPEYMSPEQAEMSGVDIDTRSDIYSLGVLLYELLTGTTPFDSQDLRSAAYGEIQRIIREVEPPKPSTRLSTLGDTLPGIAAHRRTEPARLSRMIRGDLDWIVMKALEKDRTRRYETANNLADDVRRHLSGEPVNAAPPSTAYRVRKFVRRHKFGAAATAAIAAALILGIAGTTWGFLRARDQRDRAIAAERQQQRLTEAETVARNRAEQVTDFVRRALTSSDPNNYGQKGLLVVDAMMQAIRRLDGGALKDSPDVEADLRRLIAQILDGDGRSEEALPIAQRSLEMLRAIHPGDDRGVALCMNVVGTCLISLGRVDDALPLQQSALDMLQRIAQGGDDEDVAMTMNNLARCIGLLNRPADSLTMMQESLAMSQRLHPGDDPSVAMSMANVGYCLFAQSRFEEALSVIQSAVDMDRRFFKHDDPDVALHLQNLAAYMMKLDRPTEALANFKAALEMDQRLFGGDHPIIAVILDNIGMCLRELGRVEESKASTMAALEMNQRLFKGDHITVAYSMMNVAELQKFLGNPDDAEKLLLDALAMWTRLGVRDDPKVAWGLMKLAELRLEQGRSVEAEALMRDSLAMQRRLQPQAGADLATALHHHADLLQKIGRLDDALAEAREAFDLYQAHPDWPPVESAHACIVLMDTLRARGEMTPVEDERLQREIVAGLRLADSVDDMLAVELNNLASCLSKQGRQREALEPSREALSINRRLMPAGSEELCRALSRHGTMLLMSGTPEDAAEAEPLLRENLEIRRTLFPDGHPDVWRRFSAMNVLGGALVGEAQDPNMPTEMRIAKLREAEPLVIDGYMGMKDAAGVPSPAQSVGGLDYKRVALERIIRLYELWAEAEPGRGYDAKAAMWRARLPSPATATAPATQPGV